LQELQKSVSVVILTPRPIPPHPPHPPHALSCQQRITSASPGAFLPIASPLMFGLMSTDEAGLLPETSPPEPS